MLDAVKRWFKRNQTNLLIGASVIGAGYIAGQYVLSKLQEARQRMGEERIAKENLRRRFEQNQEDCTYTVLALLPTVRDEIVSALPVEQISEQLQQERQERLNRLGASEAGSTNYPSAAPSTVDEDGRSFAGSLQSSYIHASQMATSSSELSPASPARPKRTKAQLWQDMKINSVTRALTLIYTLCMLTLLTRVQLNLLGRRTYLSSVVALASPPNPANASTISLENRDDDNYENAYGNDFETNRKYLTFSWWLLHRGSKKIMDRVMAAVKEVFGQVNIREDVSLESLAELIMQVRKKIEGATEEERRAMKWLDYLLPPKEEELFVIRQSGTSDSDEPFSPVNGDSDPLNGVDEDDVINKSLRRLLDETADLIESPTFSFVLTRILDTAFSHLVDYRIATESFNMVDPVAPGQPGDQLRITEIPDTRCKIAHILPVFCRQAHAIAVGSGELDALAGVAAQGALGNEYLAAIDKVSDLEAFAALVYSSNWEYEPPEHLGPRDVAQRSPALQLTDIDLGLDLGEVSEAPERLPPANTLDQSEVLVLNPGPEEDQKSDPATASSGTGLEAAWQRATTPILQPPSAPTALTAVPGEREVDEVDTIPVVEAEGQTQQNAPNALASGDAPAEKFEAVGLATEETIAQLPGTTSQEEDKPEEDVVQATSEQTSAKLAEQEVVKLL